MNELYYEKVKVLNEPTMESSYQKEDCIFLLKNVNAAVTELSTDVREQNMAQGVHYSEMLPQEYFPTAEYLEVFHDSLRTTAKEIAQYVADVTELILKKRGKDVILVSLARAGTPIGVLMSRYIQTKYGFIPPHYAVSIIRGKGIDENAMIYMINKHQSTNFQFIDGWTGKGMINDVLKKAVADFKDKYDIQLNAELAVLADPSQATSIYGTRKDFLIPSACLNSTVSGLVSRTFCREDVIGENDFHGAKYYSEWENEDVSNYFVEEVAKYFPMIHPNDLQEGKVLNTGMAEVLAIRQKFGVNDINKIKPGVGETTRVLLRRVPWKILVDSLDNPDLKHILLLAKDRNVPVEVYSEMNYSCIGLIKDVAE